MAELFKVNSDDKLNLKYQEDRIITIINYNKNLNIHYDLSNGEYKILIFNNANEDVILKDDGIIDNAKLVLKYIDLNSYDFKQETNINFLENCEAHVDSIYLGINSKDINFRLVNDKKNSTVSITNNVVCLNEALFNMNVIGRIEKKATNSKHFQKSRCLTIASPKKASILPVLEIDNNDVEASHSLSSGTLDENILFYMNSRGLNYNQSLNLILISYLLPNSSFYEGFELGEEIEKISKEKVDNLCLI